LVTVYTTFVQQTDSRFFCIGTALQLKVQFLEEKKHCPFHKHKKVPRTCRNGLMLAVLAEFAMMARVSNK
jgi:hypothetical protein